MTGLFLCLSCHGPDSVAELWGRVPCDLRRCFSCWRHNGTVSVSGEIQGRSMEGARAILPSPKRPLATPTILVKGFPHPTWREARRGSYALPPRGRRAWLAEVLRA